MCARPAGLKGQMMGQSPLAQCRVTKASAMVAQGFGGIIPRAFFPLQVVIVLTRRFFARSS